jgi:hypothetical protein
MPSDGSRGISCDAAAGLRLLQRARAEVGSGVWETAVRGEGDGEALANAVHAARSVLGALGVNAEWLRSTLADHPVPGAKEALDDVVTCCARLNELVERAFVASAASAHKNGRDG